MGERAARWFRVSTNGQTEDNQVPEVDGHIGQRGYEVARTFRLHDVSASNGKQEPALAEVVADMAAGRYTVLVVAHSSRIDRREDLDLQVSFLTAVRAAGGRVESVREPQFGQTDLAGRIVTLVSQHANAEYSRTLKEHIGAAMRARAAEASFIGSEPWGAVSVGPKGSKYLVPTNSAHAYGPEILERIAAGASLGDVARWLTAEGVAAGRGYGTCSECPRVWKVNEKTGRGHWSYAGQCPNGDHTGELAPWWAKSVAAVVRSKTLLGESPCAWKDQNWIHRFDAVVSHDVWLAANKSLDERGAKWHDGAARTGRKSAEPLSGVSRCEHCSSRGIDSPMYRLTSGNLRCTGRGADRKGCGVMLPMATARDLADLAFGEMTGLLYAMFERKRVPGNAAELEIRRDELEQREREIANSAMTRAERRAAMAALDAEYEALEATEIIPDTEETLPTGEDYAAYWARLDADGRRGFLRSGEFSVRFGRADGTERRALDGWGIWLDFLDDDEDIAA